MSNQPEEIDIGLWDPDSAISSRQSRPTASPSINLFHPSANMLPSQSSNRLDSVFPNQYLSSLKKPSKLANNIAMTSANMPHGNMMTHGNMAHAIMSHANMAHTNMTHGSMTSANMAHGNMPHANMTSANMPHSNMSHSNMSSDSMSHGNMSSDSMPHGNMSSANMPHTNMSSANMPHTNMTHANMASANMSHGSMPHTNMTHANMASANMSHGSMPHTNMTHANMASANMSHPNIPHGNRAHVNMPYANMSSANMPHANMAHTNMTHANMPHTNMSHANMSSDSMPHGNMTSANMPHANMSHANMPHGNRAHANMAHGNMSSDSMPHGNMTSANMPHANMSHANMPHGNRAHANMAHGSMSSDSMSDSIAMQSYKSLLKELCSVRMPFENVLYNDVSSANIPSADISSSNMFQDISSANMSSGDMPAKVMNSNWPVVSEPEEQVSFSEYQQLHDEALSHYYGLHFQNPLMDDNDLGSYSQEEQLFNNMQEAKEKDSSSRKSDVIPQAGLDLLYKDLQDAGRYLQSVQALENFENLSLGIPSDEKFETNSFINSKLSAEAKEFKPRQQKTSKVVGKTPENCLQEAIDTLTCCPNKLAAVCSKLSVEMASFDDSSCNALANILYEACITTPNFCFNGCKLCSLFSKKYPSFRRAILKSAQKEFATVFNKLHGSAEEVSRVHNFAQFLAELYLELKIQTGNNSPIRLKILSGKLIDILEMILHEPNDANLKCVINALKASIFELEMDLEGESLGRLNTLTMWLCSYKEHRLGLSSATIARLESFRKMRNVPVSCPEFSNPESIQPAYDPFNNEEIDSFILHDLTEDCSDVYDADYEEFLKGL